MMLTCGDAGDGDGGGGGGEGGGGGGLVSKMRMLVMMGQTTMMRCAARMPAVAVITVTMSP